MFVYIFIASLILLLSIVEVVESRRLISKVVVFVTSIILIVFAGFKTSGSTDYYSYQYIYENTSYFDSSFLIEPGFQLFMVAGHWLSSGFVVFYFCIALISISLKETVIYKLVPYVGVASLIYFCGCFFERDNDGIRQGLSIAFCYAGMYNYVCNRNFRFIILTIAAVTIHFTSTVFFLMPLLGRIKWKSRVINIILAGSYALSIAGTFLTKYVLQYVPFAASATKLDIYSANSDYSDSLGITTGIIFRTIVLILFMYGQDRIKINNKLYYILRNGFALSIVFSLVFNDFIIIAHRLPYVFREFQIFIVPYLVSALPDKILRTVATCIVFLYSCIILSRFFTDGSEYYNYANYLFE